MTRPTLAAAFVVLWLAFQLVLPTAQLWRPYQARFGWQMYGRSVTVPTLLVEHRDGRLTPAPDPAGPRRWGWLWRSRYAAVVCRADTTVAAVRLVSADSLLDHAEREPCSR